jgi:hypothetical protein
MVAVRRDSKEDVAGVEELDLMGSTDLVPGVDHDLEVEAAATTVNRRPLALKVEFHSTGNVSLLRCTVLVSSVEQMPVQ